MSNEASRSRSDSDAAPAQGRLRQTDGNGVCRVAILGSTGSIGTQTLDIVRMHPERFRVVALSAHSNVELLARQAREFRPDCVAIGDHARRDELAGQLADFGVKTDVLAGEEGLVEAAARPGVDTVVTAVVGAAGLLPTLAAIRAGRRIALANKETMVIAGDIVRRELAGSDSEIIPVDSEHSAIFQCLVGERDVDVERLILTASGGPFLDRDPDTFGRIGPEEALDHPNWSMGAKITIDSATMMNKGLEVIEARWLFDVEPDRIDVVIHPQSIIHSMVTFSDGSTKAQLGPPTMLVPIQYALTYPDRWSAPHETIDWSRPPVLEFRAPDRERFPCLGIAFDALCEGGAATAVLNAANEVAVKSFLDGAIPYTRIPTVLSRVLESIGRRAASGGEDTVEDRIEIDRQARRLAQELTT
ncbi:MAG: 1-deoxy-D-xylulose-5-phosphate reductoisomerase [Rhodothermales bacterium]|nr:1-deoxy-D-xylulose-5-phosphate reductoisomerase [Rhodothermales bacterium]